MVIAIDFDGTCVTHEFPRVGKDIGAVPVLKELVSKGHQLILYTMRSNFKGGDSPEFPGISGEEYLDAAIKWFKDNDIPLYGIQTNPTQSNWTSSPKCYAELYIDDAALGCPLIYPKLDTASFSTRPYVDWKAVREVLITNDIL